MYTAIVRPLERLGWNSFVRLLRLYFARGGFANPRRIWSRTHQYNHFYLRLSGTYPKATEHKQLPLIPRELDFVNRLTRDLTIESRARYT